MSDALKALEEKGLLQRSKDPKDGRAWRLFFTERGFQVARLCLACRFFSPPSYRLELRLDFAP